MQPLKEKGTYMYELFSEVVLMLVIYHMICFTPFVADLEVRFKLGYSVIAVISLHLAVSYLIILKVVFRELRQKYRIR